MTDFAGDGGAAHQLAYDSDNQLTSYQPPGNPAYNFEYDRNRAPKLTTLPSGRRSRVSTTALGGWTAKAIRRQRSN